MKKINFLIIAFLALSFISCNNEDVPEQESKAQTSIEVTLKGALQGKASGTPTQTDENVIKKFTVYVFSAGKLERSQTFTSVLTGTVSGVVTGPKQVVVIANAPADFPVLSLGADYSELAAVTSYISLDNQANLTNGLVMSGEKSVTLVPTANPNAVSIDISRIVAKIMLGTIIIDPTDTEFDATKLVLDGVAIIKAKSLSSVGIPSLVTTGPMYSGIAGPTITSSKPFLLETITNTVYANKYFYVFANDGLDGNATLMTLSGKYDGKQMYYPFVIDTPTRDKIKRNTQHTVNITLKRLGAGSPDPETPVYPTTLSVEIVPQNWVVQPVQNVEW